MVLVASSEFRQTDKTSQLWAGITRKPSSSMTVRRITKQDLEESLEFRMIEWTRVLLVGNIMRRLTNMNHRKVRNER